MKRIEEMEVYSKAEPTLDEREQQALLRKLQSEMLTLRALFYFDLVKVWGDVPFVTEPTDYELPSVYYQKPRTSRDVIYDHIIGDLFYVVDTLQALKWERTPERFNQGSVRGLLARICLHAAGYSLRWDAAGLTTLSRRSDAARVEELYRIAHEQCRLIMQSPVHNLNPSFENVFKSYMSLQLDVTYGESMYEVAFAFANNAGGGRVGVYNSSRQNELCKWGNGGGNILALPTHYILYEVQVPTTAISSIDPRSDKLLDLRRDVTICSYEITDTNTFQLRNIVDYTVGKWRRHWMPTTAASNRDKSNVNWVMLRYSDVLLMYAEAEYYLNGNTPAAWEAVNQVRRRGYGHDPSTPVPSVDLMNLTAEPLANPVDKVCREIVRERTLELAHEGLRKYDLIRWGIMDEKLKEMKQYMNELAAQNDPYGRLMLNSATDQVETAKWPADLNCYKLGEDPSLLDVQIGRGDGNTPQRMYRSFATIADDRIRIIAIDFKKYRSELYPIGQTILDANPQLTQCPAYQ
jgi:hypothetical protein